MLWFLHLMMIEQPTEEAMHERWQVDHVVAATGGIEVGVIAVAPVRLLGLFMLLLFVFQERRGKPLTKRKKSNQTNPYFVVLQV